MKKLCFSILAAVLCISAASCGPRQIKVEETGPSRVIYTTRNCSSKVGLCYKCGLNYEGDFTCGFRFSAFCPGTQSATVKETPIRISYDDGSSEEKKREEILARGICK